MKYKEALEYLEEIEAIGSKLGLATMTELMNRLGNPQDKLQVIHLAGTNGKGSVQAFMACIFQHLNGKTGQYTSPAVFDPMECIRIDGKMMTKKTYAKYVSKICKVSKEMLKDGFSQATIFEINTAIAYLYFYETKCDRVLIETGLGGSQDASNVVGKAKVCVFTAIGMDHMDYLGDTIEKITQEKAGIITEGSAVIVGVNEEATCGIIKREALMKHASFRKIEKSDIQMKEQNLKRQVFLYKGSSDFEIQMMGQHQIENAALAMEAVLCASSFFLKQEKIEKDIIKRGLYETKWLGRLSLISEKPSFYMDGAHNVQAAIKLKESLALYFTNKRIIYIIGVLKDKEYQKIILQMAPKATHIITVTPPNNARALPAYELAKVVKEVNQMVTVASSVEEAVEMAYLLADEDSVILAFGSLSYLGKLNHIVKNKNDMKLDTHGYQKE